MHLKNFDIFVQRREKILNQLFEGEGLVVFSNRQKRRNQDVFYPYRQKSDFFYLTGFDEPDSILVLQSSPHHPRSVLFVSPKDELVEKWEGFRFGPHLAKETFKFDAVYSNKEVEERLPLLLKPLNKLYCELFLDLKCDLFLRKIFIKVLELKTRGDKFLPVFEDPMKLIGEMRLFKSPFEVENIKKSVQISTEAHKAVMKNCFPGQKERILYALFLYEIMRHGAEREAYPAIVASGENACTLHYRANNSVLKKGELLLVDAGSEYNYYASDITRTYPVNGKFSSSQKRVYEHLLEIQKKLIRFLKPGISFYDLQSKAVSLLVDLLLDEGLLKGSQKSKEKIISTLSYKKFYPHGVGHCLGMDVHDVGVLKKGNKERPLEKNMCLTIEPGLYIPRETSNVDKDLRGVGFRIEDDVLITESGSENLSASCPKEVNELEEIVGCEKNLL